MADITNQSQMLSGFHCKPQLSISADTSNWGELTLEKKPIYQLSSKILIGISMQLKLRSIPRYVWEGIWKKWKSEHGEKWYPRKKSQEKRLGVGLGKDYVPSKGKPPNISRQEIPLLMQATAGFCYSWIPQVSWWILPCTEIRLSN